MNHFLITRFNIRVDDWTTTRDGYQVNQTDWLEHRFRLFMDYCWPSVLNQSDQNFTWLVFFDTTTPEQFKVLNENLVLKYPNFCPIYVDGIRSFLPSLRRELMERTNTDYLITSRIDNDDLIHRDFIKRVKEEAKPSGQLVIDMQRGYQLINKSKIFEVRNYIH
ncbi:glycosyltransferase [uncultured Roseivirga sp.]|uniref:glycosyltransferase n=1 Tax=uncultured Roseivirga sp. TaxID=543088 RepID=UPI0025844AD0|nr:glycosyltransferase [uncultured Roseivirga sp.]